MKRSLTLIVAGASLASWLAACKTPPPSETAHAGWEVLGKNARRGSHGKIDFVTHVKPVLEAKCLACHNRNHPPPPSFKMDNRKLAFAAPSRIVPGHPEKSLLIINGTMKHKRTMPPVGERLTEEEKRILTAWVAQGADWPDGAAGQLCPPRDDQR
jgi:uncharacterized membrane protein